MKKGLFPLWLALMAALLSPGFSQGQFRIEQLKCEYRSDPLGIDTPGPD